MLKQLLFYSSVKQTYFYDRHTKNNILCLYVFFYMYQAYVKKTHKRQKLINNSCRYYQSEMKQLQTILLI